MWELSRCIPYARNARIIPDSAVGKVAASIKEFGFKQPIVVDGEGVIIAGHTRLLAAERLGLSQVPVIVATDLTDAQVKAYRLADNRTGQEATWDMELLGIELEDLAGLDIDLSLTGFDGPELLLPSDFSPVDEDEQPRLDQKNPVTCPECGHVFTP
jgi:ParB-like chromosome segregation protein Spo0J